MSCGYFTLSLYGGSNIATACREAVRLANLLGMTVCFDFNGVHCGARPGDSAELLRDNYLVALRMNANIAYANELGAREKKVLELDKAAPSSGQGKGRNE